MKQVASVPLTQEVMGQMLHHLDNEEQDSLHARQLTAAGGRAQCITEKSVLRDHSHKVLVPDSQVDSGLGTIKCSCIGHSAASLEQ